MITNTLLSAKNVVREYQAAMDSATVATLPDTLTNHTTAEFSWRGMHPFYEQRGAADVARVFWVPLRQSLASMQRREDVFFAGHNDSRCDDATWVASMGYMMGLFDADWLGIPATRKLTYLRYAEFSRVENDKIAESAFFCDIIGVMQQAGHHPLPPQTGAAILPPGPKTHDGILLTEQPAEETDRTIAIVNSMIADLNELNEDDTGRCPPELLARSWHEDMLWHGPAGIGSTYTIRRYQEQHQYPMRDHLKNKVFNGHIARIAEGHYAGFFGWSNLTNTPTGGFLGLPGNEVRADMRVVDIYRRDGNKLAENWVFIDLLHWLSMQGLDVLTRLRAGRGNGSVGN